MNASSNPLGRILIIGGGIAGWMAAAFLNRELRGLGCTITLLESIKLETGTIGEGIAPALTSFLRRMRIDETQFMQQCSAT